MHAMKALILHEYNRLELTDVPEPQIAADEVLVRIKACGICGSDVAGMDGSTGRRRPPIIMGHEAAGVIEQVGDQVSTFNIGDRVTFDSTIYCGQCDFCKARRVNLCDNRRVLGVSCDDYRRDGTFAQYIAIPQHILYRIPDEVSFEHAAMIEPLSVAVHAVGRIGSAVGEAAVVIGAGLIGLLAIQVVKAAGYRRIIAADLDAGRLELASQLGADHCLNAGECDIAAEVMKLTDGGADAAFEFVGKSQTVQAAINSARKGASIVLVGNISPQVDLPLQAVVTRQLNVLGSCASSGEYPACLDMLQNNKVNVQPLISAVAPLEQGPDWFARLQAREAGLMKVILQP